MLEVLKPTALQLASSVLEELVPILGEKLRQKLLDRTPEAPTLRVEIKDAEIINKITEILQKRDEITQNVIKNNNETMEQLIQQVLKEIKLVFEKTPNLKVEGDESELSEPIQEKDQEFDSQALEVRLEEIKRSFEQSIARRLREIDGKFPGWLAIDLGTSNSTVTLFDPIEEPTPELLPKEQQTLLLKHLREWLGSSATVALPDNPSEWEKFIGDVSKNLEIESSRLHEVFQGDSQQRRLEAIRQIELCLVGRSEPFRRAVSKKLYQIYHEVFRLFTLESQNLYPVFLHLNKRRQEILSELEIISLKPLEVRMGEEEAKRNKYKAISQNTSNSLEEIISRFHHSPKRYFGQEIKFSVTVDGQQKEITANQLIQAAWKHLIKLTDDYRKDSSSKFSRGKFQMAVVAYPTIAPPLVRKDLKQLVEKLDLGIKEVQIIDEATAVVIFHLLREFWDGLNIDMEYFKTRCRRKGRNWSQNVLVLDIGGGTTDLALIKLTLEDITPPFQDSKDRDLGGRYYQITPKLLGSSGHLQLGGELITLRMFRLLKVAIVDYLLSAIATGKLQSNKLKDLIPNLNERFLENGEYKEGSLLKCIDKQYPERESAAYKDALSTAELVLPTRWKEAPQRLQTFYTLWDYAENAKITLGKSSSLTFTLSEEQISELLRQIGIENIQGQQNFNNFFVNLKSEQLERAAFSVITEAIGIASGLIKSRLSREDNTEDDYDTEKEKVDWLILSGKTCNLHIVQRDISQEFSKSDYFVWNPERITFAPEFAKRATSAGACYAEKMRQLKLSPEKAKQLLREGANQLRINVENLFFNLPCNFKRKTQTSEDFLEIFKAGQELYQISPDDKVVKVRNDWSGIQLKNIIFRQDYEGGPRQLWGSYDGNELLEELNKLQTGLDETTFEALIQIQFEIDYMLNISILICRIQPHYLIDDRNSNVIEAINASSETQALFSSEKLNHGDIAVNVYQPDAYHLVFAATKDDTQFKKFHYSSDSNQPPINGLISKPLPNFPKSDKHTFYIRAPQTQEQKWVRIGELREPSDTTKFHCQYRVSLDEKGMLRLHVGEVPYWEPGNCESRTPECLLEEGAVFRTKLDLQPNDVIEERDPFSGRH